MGFSREEYQSGLLFPCPGDLPNPGIKPVSPPLQEDALRSEPPGQPLVQVFLLSFLKKKKELSRNLLLPLLRFMGVGIETEKH